MDALHLALLGAAVLLGAATTRLTGMGFALVATPLLVLLLGTSNGVSLLLVLGFIQAPILVYQLRRDVEVKTALLLLAAAIVGIVPGAWLVNTLPAPVLAIVVGVLILVGITATVASEKARVFKGTPGLLSAGFLSGFMNSIAGIGGPAVALYALSTGWAHASFVATIQLYFFGLSASTLVARGLPTLEPAAWVVAIVALVAGQLLGTFLMRWVSPALGRRLVIAVAIAGGIATIIKGIAAL
ncbi:sulfite exporter TauE/SafE family protein [Propioniciclava tarda]|uniref:Probable membrane transporter protein n=1 Tax=Propioniciclava tarda TaxID=433330 RepID=A0A4Q9KHR7_PROTD|nr:sulfite exporter TauE/SafE family protein [Propioniciclava tarda]TBT92152.1 sulfite exporter TauE/SafE family protein [Propioniciclava tarda]SMO85464.1 hypothetical protein SAMN06266982_12610 [Propioniciclava tarda]